MPTRVNRQTVDLTPYPGLVVVYLGMRVNTVAPVVTEEELSTPDAQRETR